VALLKFCSSPSSLYTPTEVRSLIFDYVAQQGLINKADKSYIDLDELLRSPLEVKAGKGKQPQAIGDFIKRDELVKRIMAKMQNWYEVQPPGKDPVQKSVFRTYAFISRNSLSPQKGTVEADTGSD
jgi:translation initiation factor 2D